MQLDSPLLMNSDSVVSSTNLWVMQPVLRSSIKTINVSGPNKDPCGIEPDSLVQLEKALQSLTRCWRSVRKEHIQRVSGHWPSEQANYWKLGYESSSKLLSSSSTTPSCIAIPRKAEGKSKKVSKVNSIVQLKTNVTITICCAVAVLGKKYLGGGRLAPHHLGGNNG